MPQMLRWCIALLVIWNTVLVAAEDKSLARVAILTYEDETRTNNFQYMPASLTEAIDKSLQTKFEYVREDPAKSQAARQKLKPHGLLNAKEAVLYCTNNDVQILVFGRFQYDARRREIIVDTYISLGSVESFRHLKVRRNPTNATIFTLAERVADDIVAEMTLIAKEQAERAGKPKTTNEKITLEKEIPVTWTPKLYFVTVGMGAVQPLAALSDAYPATPMVAVSFNRLVWRNFYTGIFSEFSRFSGRETQNVNFHSNLTVLATTFNVGYAWFFGKDRWRMNTELGAGYYGSKFLVESEGANIYSRMFSNPVLRASTSLHFLIFNTLSIGVEAGYLQLVDDDATDALTAYALLNVGFVF
ncbi:MAG: hypothetical protein LDLANPLL_00966 [Turneriella sp.]|nr:hypothetical protein [Turneriella sp.]